MQKFDRKHFLKAAGFGSVTAAGLAGAPLAGHLGRRAGDAIGFRATAGVPRPPLPGYATHVVEGTIDPARGSGLITSRVLAGHPDAMSVIGLPGLARVIRITRVDRERGERLRLQGLVEDRSQLRRGESHRVEILLDRRRGVLHAPFLGGTHELELTGI